MRIDALTIDDHILDKIESKHGVAFEQCEQVVQSRSRIVRRGGAGLLKVFGRDDAGRYLLVVLAEHDDAWKVVTARDMTMAERRLYGKAK